MVKISFLENQYGTSYSVTLDKSRNVFTTGSIGDSIVTLKYDTEGNRVWKNI